MTLVIMAAGMGSRFGGLKQIEPVDKNGSFIIDYSIYDAISAGFDHVVFIIKEENLQIFKSTVGRRVPAGIKVDYAFQSVDKVPSGCKYNPEREKPWGTGHAVLCCKELVNAPFIVINSDDYYGADAYSQLAEFLRGRSTAGEYAMAGYILSNTLTENGTVSRGVCEVDENGCLTDIVERLKLKAEGNTVRDLDEGNPGELSPESIVSMNLWGFTPEIFGHLEHKFCEFLERHGDELKSEFFLPFAVRELMEERICAAKVIKTEAKWYGVTYAEDKQGVVDFLAARTAAGDYPDKF